MTAAQTVKKVMEQKFVRGTPVLIANSFGKAELRGQSQIVSSKGPVKCNKGGRCAGSWCIGLAVFVADPSSVNEDKEMGWRGGSTKVCLTHVKDTEGNLVLPPPALQVARSALESRPESSEGLVTWEDIATAVSEQDWTRLSLLSRALKRENESLKTQMIALQQREIERLTTG